MSRCTPFLLLAALFAITLSPALTAQDRIGRDKKKIKIEWAKHETKNYVIEHESAVPSSTAAKIGKELEEILVQYQKLFRFKPKDKLGVRFMDSQNTYEQVGGNPRAAGFYNPREKVLVIKQMPMYELVPTVYHEAFHQYLHAFVGDDVQIPIWFNEGMAVYYEGMQRDENTKQKALNPKKIKRGKIRMVKDAINTRTSISLETLVDVTHDEFHQKKNEALYYSQSFAVMYFFM